MNSKLTTTIETVAFFTLTVTISSLTMLGALGVDPFIQDTPLMQQTIAKGVNK